MLVYKIPTGLWTGKALQRSSWRAAAAACHARSASDADQGSTPFSSDGCVSSASCCSCAPAIIGPQNLCRV